MKLLIVAGGGGHFAAALAVIKKLPKDWDIMVIGRQYAFEGDSTESFESQTAKKLGIKFASITTGRLQRRLTRHTLSSLLKVPVGYLQAHKIIKSYQPDILLSFGGYVSVPVALAARTLKVPIIVHEQILGAGLANKFVATFAKKVCVSWEQSKKFFPAEKVVLTGNPIKPVILERSHNGAIESSGDKKIIYVTGGSGGSHALNALIEGCLEKLLEKYIVIHQTGDAKEFGDFDRLQKKKEGFNVTLQKRYMVTKFIDSQEVMSVLEKVDLVVSRSGINTVSELLQMGKPCLIIPLPYGQHNEQLTNALFVKQIGLGEVAEQNLQTPEKLYERITEMINHIGDYRQHSKDAQAVIIPDAAEKIITVIKQW